MEPGPQKVAQVPGASCSWRHSGWPEPSVAARRYPLLSRKPQNSVAVLTGAGRGHRGTGFLPTQGGFQVSGLRMDCPPGLPHSPSPLMRPGPQAQGQGKVCAPGPSWPVCCSYDVTLRPPGKDPHSARRITPAVCFLPCSRKTKVAVGCRTQETVLSFPSTPERQAMGSTT